MVGTAGFQNQITYMLAEGGLHFVNLPVASPRMLREAVIEYGATSVSLVPTLVQGLVREGPWPPGASRAVETVIVGGAPCPPAWISDLRTLLPQAALINSYGLTEVGGVSFAHPLSPETPGYVGPPPPGVEVAIHPVPVAFPVTHPADFKDRSMRDSTRGEVWLRRVGAPPRFFVGEEQDGSDVFSGEWVRTGDIGHLDVHGHLHLEGRIKESINRGGHELSPSLTDNVLCDHPAIEAGAGFRLNHPTLGEALGVAIVLKPDAPALSPQEVRQYLVARLGQEYAPSQVILVDAIPHTSTGKVRRNELTRLLVSRPTDDKCSDALESTVQASAGDVPRDQGELSKSLQFLFQTTLKCGPVRVDDDFFELGGDSVAALHLASLIDDMMPGVSLELAHLFEASTPRALAERLWLEISGTVSPSGTHGVG